MTRAVDKQAFFERIEYTPHSKAQVLFHQSMKRFKLPCCGRRFGKSTMAARDLEPEMLQRDKGYYWIIGPTYDLGEKEFRVMWDDLIIKCQLGKDKRVKKAYNKRSGEMYIEMPWGKRVEVRSAQYPETLVGEGLSGAIMSEAAKHRKETWERFIRPALSDKRGGATFPTTPEGQNWYYDLWLLGQNPDNEYFESWRFPSWENSVVYPGGRTDSEILLLEDTTTPDWFMQEIGADFTAFVGKIYGEFDLTIHVKPHTFNPAWPNYMAWDWGFVNPLACIEFQVDPWDNIYIWREHYKSYTILEEHFRLLREREQPPGYRIDGCFGDAADPEAAMRVSAEIAPCIADPDAKTNWRQGVDRVKSFLKEYQIGEADEYGTPISAPKLWVANGCANTIREFSNYRAAEGSPNKGPKDIAQGIDDHAMDAIRYALVQLYDLGARHHLVEVMRNHPVGLSQHKDPVVAGVSTATLSGTRGFFSMDKEF